MLDLDLLKFYDKVIENQLENKILKLIEEDTEFEEILDLIINEKVINND